MGSMNYQRYSQESETWVDNEAPVMGPDKQTCLTAFRFVPGTIKVYRNFARLVPGLHYDELGDASGFKFRDPSDGAVVRVDYRKA